MISRSLIGFRFTSFYGNHRAKFSQSAVNGCRSGKFDTPHSQPRPRPRIAFGGIAMFKQFATFLTAALACGTSTPERQRVHQPTLTAQNSGTTNGLIAVWPVNPRVVWCVVAPARSPSPLTAVDVESRRGAGRGSAAISRCSSFSANVAYLMSIGTSGIQQSFASTRQRTAARPDDSVRKPEPECFYDALPSDPAPGNAHSDSVNGGSLTCAPPTEQPADISNNMPAALPGKPPLRRADPRHNTRWKERPIYRWRGNCQSPGHEMEATPGMRIILP